jgi:nucleotide-binding universal stress UspA family protein
MKSKILLDKVSDVSASSEQTDAAHGSERLIAYRLLLVPVDFSEHSKMTIQYARQLAALTGAGIRLLHVFQIPKYPAAFYHGPYLENEAVKLHLETAKCKVTAQLSLIAEQMHANGLQAEPILRHGNPYEEIVNAAKELGVDLIVIGYHGYTGLGHLLVGSTADRVLQCAPCPVLVVKDPFAR